MIREEDGTQAPPRLVDNLKARLSDGFEEHETGRPRLSVTLPARTAMDCLAETLVKLLLNDT